MARPRPRTARRTCNQGRRPLRVRGPGRWRRGCGHSSGPWCAVSSRQNGWRWLGHDVGHGLFGRE
eukprot:774173-Lingulodinium_polyedra.AAC.1